MFTIDFTSRVPIYEQICNNVIRLASAGVFNMSSGIRGTCGGGFYDSGGSGGNYGNSENRTMAFQSSNGNRLSVTFTSFSVETCCDRLYIYD